MDIVIIEDEIPAVKRLEKLIAKCRPEFQVVAVHDSVEKSVQWLRKHPHQPSLIFMDVQLADGVSFDIFSQIELDVPIIFTTAYHEYALKAFKVNSVDYLLKPIDKTELEQSLEKYQSTQKPANNLDVGRLLEVMNEKGKTYQQRFIVSRRDKIMSVKVAQIAYFEGEDRYVYLVKQDGSRYIIDYKLSDLEELLDPAQFFRLNRSFIAHFESIDRITSMSKSRVKVDLVPAAKRDIVVSSANTRGFKMWLDQ